LNGPKWRWGRKTRRGDITSEIDGRGRGEGGGGGEDGRLLLGQRVELLCRAPVALCLARRALRFDRPPACLASLRAGDPPTTTTTTATPPDHHGPPVRPPCRDAPLRPGAHGSLLLPLGLHFACRSSSRLTALWNTLGRPFRPALPCAVRSMGSDADLFVCWPALDQAPSC
jgi:hypothetical protein